MVQAVVVAAGAVAAGVVAAAPEDLHRGTTFGLYTRLLLVWYTCIRTYVRMSIYINIYKLLTRDGLVLHVC